MDKKNKAIETLFKNLRILLVGLIFLLIFREHLVMIISMVFFTYIGHYTQKISRVVPHISIETVTPSSILIGYLYGWPYGLAFGLIVGFTGFLRASQVNLTILVICLVMGLVGVLGAFFHTLGVVFWLAYLISYVIRGATTYVLMSALGQDPVENIMHSFVESGYNMAVVIHFMIIFYNIITALS